MEAFKYKKIILVSLDTLRSDCINTNPNKLYPKEYRNKVQIENSVLDDISKESVFFTNTISVAPYTSASHAAYFSGQWQKNNGIFDQFNSKFRSRNIFEIFKDKGYDTVFKTDFPFVLGKYLNLTQGVNNYSIEDDEKALEALNNHSETLAFFHFGQIHYPYGFHSLSYAGDDYEKKIEKLEKEYKISQDSISLDDMAVETFRDEKDLQMLFRYKTIISYLYRNKLDNELFDLYLEGINYFHKNRLNNFLSSIKRVVDENNYLLVIFGDHGEAWNELTYGHHNASDEGVLRVPLIFYASNLRPRIYSNRIRTIDLLPTILDLNEFDSTGLDGKSLFNIINAQDTEVNRDAFSAVWVNEIRDVIDNSNKIIEEDEFTTKQGGSIKYNATFYKDEFKLVRNYKKFTNRSEVLEDFDNSILYKFDKDLVPKEIHDEVIKKYLEEEMNKLNNIETSSATLTTQNLRDYFKLQGYNV